MNLFNNLKKYINYLHWGRARRKNNLKHNLNFFNYFSFRKKIYKNKKINKTLSLKKFSLNFCYIS